MEACPELCVLCRHFGLYDADSGRYYCAGIRSYFTDFRKECGEFSPAEEKKEAAEPSP